MLNDGRRIKDVIPIDTYSREMHEYKKLERALGELRESGNSIKYKMIQPLFGWMSYAFNDDPRPYFKSLNRTGAMDMLKLFVYYNYEEFKLVNLFMECVLKNMPVKIKIYLQDASLYDYYGIEEPTDAWRFT